MFSTDDIQETVVNEYLATPSTSHRNLGYLMPTTVSLIVIILQDICEFCFKIFVTYLDGKECRIFRLQAILDLRVFISRHWNTEAFSKWEQTLVQKLFEIDGLDNH